MTTPTPSPESVAIAREIAISLGRDYPDVIERVALAIDTAVERERERCAGIHLARMQDHETTAAGGGS